MLGVCVLRGFGFVVYDWDCWLRVLVVFHWGFGVYVSVRFCLTFAPG